jgi:hypothetical protein
MLARYCDEIQMYGRGNSAADLAIAARSVKDSIVVLRSAAA